MKLKDKLFNKEVKEYLLRLFWFCVTVKYAFIYIGGIVFLLFCLFVEPHVNKLGELITNIQTQNSLIQLSYYSDKLLLNNINCSVAIYAFITVYFLSKIFGIFKKLDKLNFLLSLAIMVLVTILLILIGKIGILYTRIFFVFIALYLSLIFLSFFKKKDKIFILAAILFITFIYLCGYTLFSNSKSIYEFDVYSYYPMYFLIPSFLLYKVFGFLTKILPMPFKYIGYFFSIEFYKDLYKKLKH